MTMTVEFNPDTALKLVADSWDKLRRCDVYRLFDGNVDEYWPGVYQAIREKRPDLLGEAQSAADAINCERRPYILEDQPLDRPGYARMVGFFEWVEGMTTSDAQATADAWPSV